MEQTPLVTNAADEAQVKAAGRSKRRAEDHRHDLLAAQLSTPRGREFVWVELDRAGVFAEILATSMEAVFWHVGRRSAAHALFMECMLEHPEAFRQMQAEAAARLKRDEHERKALHTKRTREQA